MSSASGLQLLIQLPFLLIFVVVLIEFVRRPSRTSRDILVYFGSLTLIVGAGWISNLAAEQPPIWLRVATSSLLLALPYLLMRLLNDFIGVRFWLMRAAEVGLFLSIVAVAVWREENAMPLIVTEAIVAYFLGVEAFVALQFLREARRVRGSTRLRMRAAALGSALLGLVILFAGAQAASPQFADVWAVLSSAAAIGSGLAHLAAFAPPGVLRRSWQAPSLRQFLLEVGSKPFRADLSELASEIEMDAKHATGAEGATLLLWSEADDALYSPATGRVVRPGVIAERAFRDQRLVISTDPGQDDPTRAALYEEFGAKVVIAVPVVADDRVFGVLAIYSAYRPLFNQEETEVLQIVASQAAVSLEVRRFAEETSALAAREEATQLKEEFLSAAAHDLRTPLTTILGQAQLLQRRLQRDPDAAVGPVSVNRIVGEAQRMRELIDNLLDATRADQPAYVEVSEPVDLVRLVSDEADRITSDHHHVWIECEPGIVVEGDARRLRQLVQNLLDNAVKYSPGGGDIGIRLQADESEILLSVRDDGIGIPPQLLPRLFERFWRADEGGARTSAGMGLGLYICRRIVEGHRGRIWATSGGAGAGSKFWVALPVRQREEAA